MWKRSGLLYSRYITQRRTIFSNSHETNVSTKSINAIITENLEYVPKEARVVICGGGVMGGAVAYHLSRMGLGLETVLIESGR